MVVDNLTARDLMSGYVKTVSAESTLTEAAEILDASGYGQLPVVAGRKPVSLLTETDIRRALMAGRQHAPVGELASPLPQLVTPEARLSEVLNELDDQDSILVVNEEGHLVGIITYWDILVVARPFLMVSEVELMLRKVVAGAYRKAYGDDWWHRIDEDLRRRAEEEHRGDGHKDPDGEHMLGHTSFWALIECFRDIAPNLPDGRFDDLHRIREMRNRVAHHYRMSRDEERNLVRRCIESRDWLQSLLDQEEPN